MLANSRSTIRNLAPPPEPCVATEDISASTPLQESTPMNINLTIAPLISLVAGIMILLAPRLLNYIVAVYLILLGLIGLFAGTRFHIA